MEELKISELALFGEKPTRIAFTDIRAMDKEFLERDKGNLQSLAVGTDITTQKDIK